MLVLDVSTPDSTFNPAATAIDLAVDRHVSSTRAHLLCQRRVSAVAVFAVEHNAAMYEILNERADVTAAQFDTDPLHRSRGHEARVGCSSRRQQGRGSDGVPAMAQGV